MSGDTARGLKGVMRVKGVSGVFLVTARVWMKDDSNDLAATMKMLDQRMSQAKEWGISLRLLSGIASYVDHDGQVVRRNAPDDHGKEKADFRSFRLDND